MNKSLRLVHSVPVEVDEWSRELLHVHSSTLGDPCTVAKPPIGANHGVADFAPPQRLTELVMARAAAAVGVVRVSGFDVTRARWCPYIVPSSHGQRAALRERARSVYSGSVESCVNWA